MQIWCTAAQSHEFVRPALLATFGEDKMLSRYLWRTSGEFLHGFVVAGGDNASPGSLGLPQLAIAASGPSGDSLNISVPLDFILACTQPEDWVADFMCGSGTAAVAAAFCGRNSFSVDISAQKVMRPLNSYCLYLIASAFILFSWFVRRLRLVYKLRFAQ